MESRPDTASLLCIHKDSQCVLSSTGDNAHHQPSFGEVIDIRVLDAMLRDRVTYKTKPRVYRVWIFALGPLIVVLAKKARPELRLSLDEVRSPALPNWGRVAVGKQSIGHIFHTTDARRKRSGIQVEDILN